MKRTRTCTKHVPTAANRMVPAPVAVMATAFSSYLVVKGVHKIVPVPFPIALLIGVVGPVFVCGVMRR